MKAKSTLILSLCFVLIQTECIDSDYDDCLIITPYIRNGSISLAKQLSEVNSENFFDIKSHSGFITVNEKYNSNLFFWFFPVGKLEVTPWIIWLQGGPGVTSLMGLFDLMGPIQVEEGEIVQRNVTWCSDYSMLFLDNPVGAGFSFTAHDEGYLDNEDDIGVQLYEFLDQFLQVFPELRDAPLFIAGESYAAKYVLTLGIHIHRHNDLHRMNLKGLSIGNGLIDPRSMMHYSELCGILGLLDDKDIKKLQHLEESVVRYIDTNEIVKASNAYNKTIEYIKDNSGVNILNFNLEPDSYESEFEAYLNKPEVRKLIHVGNATFDLDNQVVYEKMLPDIMNTTKPFMEELLEHYPIMSYSGQLDILLPYGLSKYTYKELRWSRRAEYVSAPRRRLRRYASGNIVGYKKAGGNFVEVLLRHSGHLVPADQPEIAKFLIDNFIQQCLK